MLNLMVAASAIRDRLDVLCAEQGITHGQYNVLRILRGAHSSGHPRCEIAARMVERAPDVTRIIDRLEAQGLVRRDRSDQDKRHSITRITPKAIKLLNRMQPHLDEIYRYFTRRLSARDRRELSRICEKLYVASD